MTKLTIFRKDDGPPIDVLPDVTELTINEPVSSLKNLNEVLRALPNLQSLLFYVMDYGKIDLTESLSFICGVKQLKSLTLCSMPHLRQSTPLEECRMLENLTLSRHVTNVFDFSILPSMPNLQALSVEMPSKTLLDQISKISQLTSLQAMGGFKLPSLLPLAPLVNLKRLKLWSGVLASTYGLAEFSKLQDLNLGYSKINDTRELGCLVNLKKLELIGNKAISCLNFLEKSDLELLGLHSIPKLDSLVPLLRLSELKEVRISAVLADGNLLPLVDHPSLKKATLPGRYRAQLKKLRLNSGCIFKVGRETFRVTQNGPQVLETAGEAKERLRKKLEPLG